MKNCIPTRHVKGHQITWLTTGCISIHKSSHFFKENIAFTEYISPLFMKKLYFTMFSFVCDGNKCTNLIIGCACYLYFRDSNLMHDILLILSFCGKKHLDNEVFAMQSTRQCVIYASLVSRYIHIENRLYRFNAFKT